MTRNAIVKTRIKHLLAITLVMLMLFTIRLVDIQAVRAAGIAKKVTNELTNRIVKTINITKVIAKRCLIRVVTMAFLVMA